MSGSMSKLAAVAVMAAAPLAVAGTANAADWDALAQCESSGNWSANTGNGFYGGLQFTPSTWDAYGGSQYAGNAHQATRGQQIAVAEQVLAAQGSGAWPGCSSKTSWEGGSTPQASSVTDVKAEAVTSTNASSDSAYTVQRGDTLSDISARLDVSVDVLADANTHVADPSVIYPGQTLQVP